MLRIFLIKAFDNFILQKKTFPGRLGIRTIILKERI